MYGLLNALISSVIGMIAAYCGGWLSDYFDQRTKKAKAFICAFGVLLAFPFVCLSFLL